MIRFPLSLSIFFFLRIEYFVFEYILPFDAIISSFILNYEFMFFFMRAGKRLHSMRGKRRTSKSDERDFTSIVYSELVRSKQIESGREGG